MFHSSTHHVNSVNYTKEFITFLILIFTLRPDAKVQARFHPRLKCQPLLDHHRQHHNHPCPHHHFHNCYDYVHHDDDQAGLQPLLQCQLLMHLLPWPLHPHAGNLHQGKDKNDRRSSGGTLRQKFNLIDILHLTFNF